MKKDSMFVKVMAGVLAGLMIFSVAVVAIMSILG